MPGKITVVVLFGGRSSEHSISCATAGGVLEAIDRSRYEVIPVGITAEGAFVLEADDPSRFGLGPDAASLPRVHDNGTRILWPDSTASRMLGVRDADGTVRELGQIDVVFPILHGPFGEDGTIQGLFELIGLPYVGSGVLASALGMDKHYTKTVLEKAGIAVAPWRTVTAREWASAPDAVVADVAALGSTLFVKPARAGSSVGVSKVSSFEATDAASASALSAALEVAFREDSRVLVEAAVVGREVECGVLSGRDGAAPRVSVAGEIVMTSREFYDFEAKYLDAPGIDLVCPAVLTDSELADMQDTAARAFTAIDGSGLARVDFFLTPTGLVVNEINTMPGFTPISMFPKCWIASGVTYPALIDELIALALEP
ncbi:D-alanine--D-alanine ligase family protein [Herbiconiux sp.]|uniref:D-alanine--D-alanine ligase family protein n=1 Tax=Herbiconiux sp. TaxID=1871186 RepID=UPI0025C0DE0E|nr:D-alanine--D-alanine ligase family protein [Herbiconiux sp.]